MRQTVAFALLGLALVACHKHSPVQGNTREIPAIKDTSRVIAVATDTAIVAFFRDTTRSNVLSGEGQTFKLQTAPQRQSLRATLRRERELWRATKPADYLFLLRVDCFCPGPRGWLLIGVRSNQPLRAWDRTGKSAAIIDWNTFSIDGLYDLLDRSADNASEVQIAFDPRWHFPRYVRSAVLPMPDSWSIIQVRGFRPG